MFDPLDYPDLRTAFLAPGRCGGNLVRIAEDDSEVVLSPAQLRQAAAKIAAQLAAAGIGQHAVILLAMRDPLAYVTGLWGCLVAGCIAVPMPAMNHPTQQHRTLAAARVIGRCILICDQPEAGLPAAPTEVVTAVYHLTGAVFDRIAELADAEVLDSGASAVIHPNDVAIIQFSSGSTGAPKGVELTHRAVLAQISLLQRQLGLVDADRFLSWLPLSHDFGLFHFHLLPLLVDLPQIQIAPDDFARRPLCWLRALAKDRTTITGAPNFALQMIASLVKPERAGRFDLRQVRILSNGAEPLNPATISAFVQTLAGAGLRPSVINPAYGLAEATLVVSMRTPGQELAVVAVDRRYLQVGSQVRTVSTDAPAATRLCLLGPAVEGFEMRIVDDRGGLLPAARVGHLQVRGPSLMRGYINNPDQSRAVLREDGWLDTGDIGFLWQDELVLVGRRKDVVIVAGQNYHPVDLERVAEQAPGLSAANPVALVQARHPLSDEIQTICFVRFRGHADKAQALQQSIIDHLLAQTGVLVQQVIPVHQLPRTTSGKVKRYELGQRFEAGEFGPAIQPPLAENLPEQPAAMRAAVASANLPRLTHLIRALAAHLSGADIAPRASLMDQGLTSQQAVALVARVSAALGRTIGIVELFEHPSPEAFARALIAESQAADAAADAECALPRPTAAAKVAVIGFGCRFPGADDADAFWELLLSDRDLVRPIPPERWSASAWPQDLPCPGAALLEDIDGFDAELFGITPGEAAGMQPLQRLLLQVIWQGLEHGGIDPLALAGQRVGLFIGLSESGLGVGDGRLLGDAERLSAYSVTGHAASIAVGRVAHLFDLRGPAIAVDTACSSSLVALDLAVRCLRDGECDLAIAGGANLILSPDLHAGLERMGVLSADGRCKTFADEADGYGRGEGAGVVVLKRLGDARRSQDCIWAEVLGTAVNQDGRSQSVTAPNGAAQRDLLRRVLQQADIDAEAVDWVETHGTGTPLGDPIELTAIREVLRPRSAKVLPLGAVKSRIGHLEAAAGIAGVIKVLLAMWHGHCPANAPRKAPNARYDWSDSPLRPLDQPLAWAMAGRRVAAVSSFGMSGTNAQVLLGQVADAMTALPLSERLPVLPLAAHTIAALEQLSAQWTQTLADRTPQQRAHLCAGQAARRFAGPFRMALSVTAQTFSPAPTPAAITTAKTAAPVVFCFTGQGVQFPGMAAELFEHEPVFRAAFLEASAAAGAIAGQELERWLYGPGAADVARLNETDLAQPALTAVAHALVRLWADWGVRPDAVIGHSSGEIAAALVAGQLDLGTAMALAVRRGSAMRDAAPVGAMFALRADEASARGLIADLSEVVIAGYNAPRALTLSGTAVGIDNLRARAAAAGLPGKILAVTRAFHSPQMALAAARFSEGLQLPERSGQLPVFSTLSGERLGDAEMTKPEYWTAQMQSPVLFCQALAAAAKQGDLICMEIGPRAQLAKLGPASAPGTLWVGGGDTRAQLAQAAGQAWCCGAGVDWPRYFGSRGAFGHELPRLAQQNQPIPRRPWTPEPSAAEPNRTPQQEGLVAGAAKVEQALQEQVLPLLGRVSGVAPAQIDPDRPMVTLGLDSLGMVQVQRSLATAIGLRIELGALFQTLDTPRKLADYIDAQRLPPLVVAAPTAADTASDPGVVSLMQQQLRTLSELMEQQLAVLGGQPHRAPQAVPTPVRSEPGTRGEIKGLFRQPAESGPRLNPRQQAQLADLARRWNSKSGASKAAAQHARRLVANSRAVFGFTPDFKELTYPLMASRASGSRVWDIDGHEYIDVTMGFGVYLFGHSPPFVLDALNAELATGAPLGPASPLAAEVAERIHQLTGVERCAFFTTGTEAVMCGVRIARAVTGRDRILVFKGAYHGSFDGVLATGWIGPDGRPQTAPLTEGTPQSMVDPVIVLDYGDMSGLEVIRRYATEIALVLVEPVQSRNPGNRPVDFLRALRTLTREQDIPLLFDEIISGFRFALGGMQAVFGVKADLVTYGKVLGSGQPIGVLAGDARLMDAIDGGHWSYGDASAPGTRTAFVAGTFNAHPLALAAARAVLDHLMADGGALQQRLAERTDRLCRQLDDLFAAAAIPVQMEWYGSLFRFRFQPGSEILNTHLLNEGVFVWEQRNCFLSTAHSDEDIAAIIAATRRAIAALTTGGWFGDAPLAGGTASAVLRPSVSESVMRRRAGAVQPGMWTDLVILRCDGEQLAHQHLKAAWEQLVRRHAALRACLGAEGNRLLGDAMAPAVEYRCLPAGAEFAEQLGHWSQAALVEPFRLDQAPVNLTLLEGEGGDQALALRSSHLGFDGWSVALILRELFQLLAGEPLAPADSWDAYLAWEAQVEFTRAAELAQPARLPCDQPASARGAAVGRRITRTDLGGLFNRVFTAARAGGQTPLAGMLAVFATLLGRLSGDSRVTVGLPVAGQMLSGCTHLVGNFSFIRPLTLDIAPAMTLAELRRHCHLALLAPGQHPPADALPPRHVLFNIDGPIRFGTDTQRVSLQPAPICGARADLFANILLLNEQVVLDFDWNSERFTDAAATAWLEAFITIAARSCRDHVTLADLVADLDLPPPPAPARPDALAAPARPTPPATATEQQLAQLWRQILGVQPLDRSADFFALGGGSLQAVRLTALVHDTFGVKLPLEQVFAAPALAQMARQIETATAAAPSVTPTRPLPPAVPATRQQQQLWLLEQMSAVGSAYHLCLRLDFGYRLDGQVLAMALPPVAARHASLRTRFAMNGESLVQAIASASTVSLEEFTAVATDWAEPFAQRPFDLGRGPLWRVGLASSADGCTLLLVLHHVIADAWSMEVMARDLLGAYQRLAAGHDGALPPLALDYPDYALTLADNRQAVTEALSFWRKQLHSAPGLTALPGDFPRPAEKSFAGARASLVIDPPLRERIDHCARTLGSSRYQIMVATIAELVARRTGALDLVFGTVAAGRDLPGLEQPVGFFANTLPLRLVLEADWSARDLVAAVRKALMAANAQTACSLQEICAALALPPDPAANPLFEICVTHDDRSGLGQLGAELGFGFAELPLPWSQFDLSFYVVETGAGVTLEVTYATSLFTAETVATILTEVAQGLARLCGMPAAPLELAAAVSPDEGEPSALQQRLWFVDQFENGQLYAAAPTYYNVAALFALGAETDETRLMHRCERLLNDAPPLRVAFVSRDGRPRRRLLETAACHCASISGEEIEAQMRDFILRPFALDTGPLLRLAIVARSAQQRELLLVGHHIIVDEDALQLIADWLIHDRPNPPPLAAPHRPAEAVLQQERAFWSEYLGAHPPRLLLPVDRARAAVHVFGSGFSLDTLAAAPAVALADLAKQCRLTLDDLVLAAFVALLSRLSGQDDIVLGLTVARTLPGLGGHGNLVTLRVTLDPQQSTADALAAIGLQASRALANAATPFDQVVLDLKPDNDMSRTALFDVLYARSAEPVPGRRLPPACGWGKYDLTLAVNRTPDGGLDRLLVFNTEQFDAATVGHWNALLGRVLTILPDKLTTPFLRLPLAADADIPRLIAAGAPRQLYHAHPDAHLGAAVAAFAQQAPDALAVSDHQGVMTYRALEAQARLLAARLLAQGVQSGDRVALMLPRDRDTPVAMLAVLFSGAAFVPLDLHAPRDRTACILEDAGVVGVIVKASQGAERLPPALPRIDVAERDAASTALPLQWPPVRSRDAAYVIFTSGSSGRPKGVVVEHRNVLALVLGQGDLFPVAAGDRWSWFHSVAFDFSIWEIWGPLLTGGQVVVMPESARGDFGLLRAYLKDQGVTHLSVTPSAFKVLSDHEMTEPRADLALRSIWFGGEALTPTLLRDWARRYPECDLINLFGITETTVHTTFRRLAGPDLEQTDSLIGQPLPSCGVTIRDADLRPVPATVQGEIVVSGSGVARGYLNRSELTAERFVDDPYAPGTRLYRSGDLGRYAFGGELTSLGRADNQVKVRGFRIELGEIETALHGFPTIGKAVAGVLEIPGEEAVLAAWILANQEPNPDQLTAHLNQVLPAYMIPQHLYLVDQFPLTLNGKVDRRALMEQCAHRIGGATAGDTPRPGLETKIAHILCELLGRDAISRTASFFALGGHSLMANQAVLRLRQRLGLALTLREFFTAQSVTALAVLAQKNRPLTVDPQSAERIIRAPDAESYPVSSAQRRLFAVQNARPESTAYNMVGGFILTGALDTGALARAWSDLTDRHEILRTRFVTLAGEVRQVIDPPGRPFSLTETAAAPDRDEQEAINQALDQEFHHPFDLSRGPLLRVALTPLGPERWLMVINLHHIVSDGWSVPILLEELSHFYAARRGLDDGLALASLPIQYRDFAVWQQTRGSGPQAQAALAHWRARLGADTALKTSLPTDAPRAEVRAGHGAMEHRLIERGQSDALRDAAARAGLTLFAVFAAALHAVLELRAESAEGTGEGTVIGTADAGRDALETESQLGFYLNLLPHVLHGDGRWPIQRWMNLSQAETAAMLGHKDYPFDALLESLEISAAPGHNPIFDILLLLQNNALAQPRLGDLELMMLPDQTRTARYDLNLMVEDRPQIELVLEYDTDLFAPQTMTWFLEDLLRLLHAFVEAPDRSPLEVLSQSAPNASLGAGLLDMSDPLMEV